jgi:hypothetical protein
MARWLKLAASPVFALMALANALAGPGVAALCSASAIAPIGSMTTMYALMALFHAPPWLGLFAVGRPHGG